VRSPPGRRPGCPRSSSNWTSFSSLWARACDGLELQLGVDRLHVVGVVAGDEAWFFADGAHVLVHAEHDRVDPVEALVAGELEEPAAELGAEALVLVVVAHDRGHLGGVRAVLLRETAHGHDLWRGLLGPDCDKDHLAVVIDETDAGEALMRDPLRQLDRGEVA